MSYNIKLQFYKNNKRTFYDRLTDTPSVTIILLSYLVTLSFTLFI